jgi:predicted alpha/beta-fold hydrolase
MFGYGNAETYYNKASSTH